MENLSKAATLVRILSVMEASRLGYDYIGVEQLFLALARLAMASEQEMEEYAKRLEVKGESFRRLLFEKGQVEGVFRGRGISSRKLHQGFSEHLGQGRGGGGEVLHRNPACRQVFAAAQELARDSGNFRVLPVHLLWAVLAQDDNPPNRFLRAQGVSPAELVAICRTQADLIFSQAAEGKGAPQGEEGSSFLAKLGRDLTRAAEEGGIGQVVGMEGPIQAICQTLIRKDKNSVALVGEAGVGKTAAVEGLAKAIVEGTLPPKLRQRFAGVRVYEISMGALVAGTQYRGQFEERVERLIKEARENADKVILFVDEMHTMMGAGGGAAGGMDASNLLKPALSRGEIRLIGATTEDEYKKHVAKDPAMDRRFVKVQVPEPDSAQALQILRGLRDGIEAHYEVEVETAAMQAAVELTVGYLPGSRLPAKALDALHQACANRLCAGGDQAFWSNPTSSRPSSGRPRVTRDDVAAVVAGMARLPVGRLLATREKRVESVRQDLRQTIIGQDQAIEEVCEVLLRAQEGLTSPHRPDGVFLLAGPTGVGKTELVKRLAESMFSEARDHFVRIDMSEYKDQHQVSRLLGAAPGYVGYEEGGVLTNAVQKQPHSIILFDEIEKAHPAIFDLFLQIFEEGRLTDNQGRKADFRHTLVFLTSNLGTQVQARPARRMGIGLEGEEAAPPAGAKTGREALLAELRQAMRPEIINRIDKIVVFRPFERGDLERLAQLQLDEARRRLAARQVELEVTPRALDFICRHGYSPYWGAREMRRLVEQAVMGAVARFLSGQGGQGRGVLLVDQPGDEAEGITVNWKPASGR